MVRASRSKVTPKPEFHRESMRNESDMAPKPSPKYSEPTSSDTFFSVPAVASPIQSLHIEESSSLLDGSGDHRSIHLANGSSPHDLERSMDGGGDAVLQPPIKPARSKDRRFIDTDNPERRMFEVLLKSSTVPKHQFENQFGFRYRNLCPSVWIWSTLNLWSRTKWKASTIANGKCCE